MPVTLASHISSNLPLVNFQWATLAQIWSHASMGSSPNFRPPKPNSTVQVFVPFDFQVSRKWNPQAIWPLANLFGVSGGVLMPPVPPGGLNLSVGKWRVEKSYLKMVIKHDVSYPMIIPTSWSFLTKDFTQKKNITTKFPSEVTPVMLAMSVALQKLWDLPLLGRPFESFQPLPAGPAATGSDDHRALGAHERMPPVQLLEALVQQSWVHCCRRPGNWSWMWLKHTKTALEGEKMLEILKTWIRREVQNSSEKTK